MLLGLLLVFFLSFFFLSFPSQYLFWPRADKGKLQDVVDCTDEKVMQATFL